MAERELFSDEEQDRKVAEKEALLNKKIQELESKLGGAQEEYTKTTKSWQDERQKMEDNIKAVTAKAMAAEEWDKLINENPMAAAKMIFDYTQSKTGVSRSSPEPAPQNLAEVKQLTERQEKLEKELQRRAEKEYTEAMYNAISEGMDELKDQANIEVNPKAVIEYLQRNGYTSPSQVRDAMYGLYRDQLLASTKKSREKDETVVMGTGGYPTGVEGAESGPIDMEKYDSNDLWDSVATKLFK